MHYPIQKTAMQTSVVAARIVAARRRAGLNQAQLVTATERTQSTVSDWETGKSQPSADDVAAIARATGVTADYLLGLADYPERLPPHHWVIDEDAYAAARAGANPSSSETQVPVWGVPIPIRVRIVTSSEYGQMSATLEAARRKRK